MPTTITQQEKDAILELQAKLKFLENKLADVQAKKSAEVENANTLYKSKMDTIEGKYALQVSGLQAEIADIQTQLDAVK